MSGDTPLDVVLNEKGEGQLPSERFESATQVRDLAQQMIRADDRRAWMRERVDALVSGFPTYPKSVTAAKGMGWFPRVNYREAEGKIQSQQTPLFDLVTEVPTCIKMSLDVKASSSDERADWESKIEKNWTWLLFKKWRSSFNYHIPLQQREMLVHGLGAHVWPQTQRWIPRTPKSGQILFPEGCSLDFEQDGKYFMLRDFVPGEDVYGFIRNETSATKRGWKVSNVWQTLANAGKQSQKVKQGSDIEELQRKSRRGDIGYWNTSQVGLWLNWFFVKEYDPVNGKTISLYCVEENISCGNKDKGYLFAKRFLWKEWKEVLVLFPYDIGNGDIQSVRGLGWRTKDFYELSNRINNIMAVQILISALPQLKQNQPNLDPEKMRLMRMGALNITPYGLEPSMINFPPLANGGLALQQHLRDTLENNNQSMTGSTPEPKDRETKYSFMLRAHDSSSVSNGMQSLYESNLQQFQDTSYRKVINTPKGDLTYQQWAEEFRQRCRDDGVPDEALKERAIGEIQEVTSSGAGSAAIRLQAIQLCMGGPVYNNAPESKKIQMERSLVSWTMGPNAVDRFARSEQDNQLPDPDVSFAVQENNGLSQGGEAVIGDGQNDVVHADTHLQKAEQIEQMVEQGQMPPEEAVKGLQPILAHAGQHLQRLQANPTRQVEFKALLERFKHCQQYTEQLMNEVQSQQNQPDPQQQVSDDLQIGMAKVQADSQIKGQKAQADMALKFRKQAFTERLADAKASTSIQRDNLRTGAAIGRDNLSTAHSIQRDNAKTATNIHQDYIKTDAQIRAAKAKTAATTSRNGRQNGQKAI